MKHAYLKDVVTLELDPGRCTGCGRCLEVCPQGVFQLQTNNGRKVEIRDRDACMECGACARNCTAGAVSVRAGVGCAYAIAVGKLTGKEPTCGCDNSSAGGSSCC